MEKEELIDPGQLSYEQARDELVQIVKMLESGKTPLEETLSLWERGEALAARCHAVLSAAEQRIEQARAGSASTPETNI
ncbi:exodeoxyribonuclease VII small subunit [Gleimia europaea]|uniref:Exodeoxyribonuclease 7 small subunit n=2 Tax=Actinomycetaceae TaxID=2049 RepID=A0A9W5VVU1_9ACTO|nr:exodeoxyribonuclease VII, small subunit [Gleimia europaea ACS-120-V-Col10b]